MRSLFAKLIAVAAAFALVAALVPSSTLNAQALVGEFYFQNADPVGFATVGDASSTTGDDDIALVIRYVGSDTSGGTVVVAATTGDITFATGAVGSSVADATLECPVSGALGGIIDVSNSACDTIGEVVDIINGSPNWRAVPINALASDVIDASNNGSGSLLDFTETQAGDIDGVSVYWNVDGDAGNFNLTQGLLTPEQYNITTAYLGSRVDGPGGTGFPLVRNPFAGQRSVLQYATFIGDSDSGTVGWEVISVKMEFVPIAAEAGTYDYRETATVLYSDVIVDDTADSVAGSGTYVLGRRGEKLLVRVNATADIDAFLYFNGYGFQVPLYGR